MSKDAERGPDVGTLLVRAIRADAAAAGCPVRIDSIACRPWASATFAGSRHRVTLVAEALPSIRTWIAALPDHEFAMRGHLVADLVVEQVETTGTHVSLTIAVLTLIDG